MTKEEPNTLIKCKLCQNVYNEEKDCIEHYIVAHRFDIWEFVFLIQKEANLMV